LGIDTLLGTGDFSEASPAFHNRQEQYFIGDDLEAYRKHNHDYSGDYYRIGFYPDDHPIADPGVEYSVTGFSEDGDHAAEYGVETYATDEYFGTEYADDESDQEEEIGSSRMSMNPTSSTARLATRGTKPLRADLACERSFEDS
jgi:hypothetical protein